MAKKTSRTAKPQKKKPQKKKSVLREPAKLTGVRNELKRQHRLLCGEIDRNETRRGRPFTPESLAAAQRSLRRLDTAIATLEEEPCVQGYYPYPTPLSR